MALWQANHVADLLARQGHERPEIVVVSTSGDRDKTSPLHSIGGKGIFVLREGDPNLSSMLETATDAGRSWTMAQEYLPEATEGDKRILLADGEPVGAILRVPPPGEVIKTVRDRLIGDWREGIQ